MFPPMVRNAQVNGTTTIEVMMIVEE